MTDARRRFAVNTPDWGEGHLTLDAIVAFTDGELSAGAHARATAHLAHCPECAEEVVEQDQARLLLRSASAPAMPSSLLSSLRSIPMDADLPDEPPAGLAMTPDGQLVSVLRPLGPSTNRPSDAAADPVRGTRSGTADVRLGHGRRLRIGAGVAVSGLALGALALAAPSASVDVPAAAGSPPAFGSALSASFGLPPQEGIDAATAAPAQSGPATDVSADVVDRLDEMAPSFLPPSRR